MPELPDVEGFLEPARRARGRTVAGVRVPDRAYVRNRTSATLGRALRGARLGPARRHGKWLLLPAGERSQLLVHFGMTGSLEWLAGAGGAELHSHDRVVLALDGGAELRVRDQRRFGGVWLARSERERDEVTGPLGPDARGLSDDALRARLEGRRGAIKAALMDQKVVAGVGNLLADEVLWRARTPPKAAAREVDAARLAAALRDTIEAAIPHGLVPRADGWLTAVRDEDDPRCPRCATKLGHGRVGQRATAWCPRCQRT